VQAQMERNNADCFEDQTVAEAEQIMLDANVAEAPVVTREKLVVGTTSLEAIAQEIQLEIGHVLFIDIVGYSKLLITEQSELLRRERALAEFEIALSDVCARRGNSAALKCKANWCVYRPATAWHWFFVIVRRRRCYVPWN